MDSSQQMLSHEDESNLTFIGLVGMLDPPREEVKNAMLSCMKAGIRVIVVTGDNKSTAESLCRKIGAFSHLNDFDGYSYSASEFEALSPLQRTLALQRMVLFTSLMGWFSCPVSGGEIQMAVRKDDGGESPRIISKDVHVSEDFNRSFWTMSLMINGSSAIKASRHQPQSHAIDLSKMEATRALCTMKIYVFIDILPLDDAIVFSNSLL
ncbi:hypothetical protein HPP92_027990 [Vanilla planifolia]|uniref:Uncharacterized protein n=1 Tax=Vanilla planifolia TaxID=51239 RepID=A0A835P918_VANPL|nr:hypothetical protein HPP92_027990 [Vanilla planifolia]